MKRILFVIHSLGFGGAERSLVNLLNELPQDQYEVELLLFQRRGGLLEQLPVWVKVLDTPKELNRLYGPLKKAGMLVVPKLLGKLVPKLVRKTYKERNGWRWRHVYRRLIPPLKGHYDIAVAYTGVEIQYYVAERVSAERKIVFIHNDYRTAGYSAADDEPYFAQMDQIVTISPQCLNVLEETFPQYREKLICLENITSSNVVRKRASAFDPPEYRAQTPVLLSVGRLDVQKGFDIAIDAAKILKDQGKRFQWYILGEGGLRQELQTQIDGYGLTEDVVLLGTRSNPYPYMRACDVLVQSSRHEGKSVVLDEAKMLCKPIVATAYPTVGDQVIDGQEGIVTAMTAEGVAAGVARMMEDAALREHITACLAAHEYGNQQAVVKYVQLLDE